MDRIPERIEDAGNIAIHTLAVMPDVGHGQRDVFGKAARTVHADAERSRTQVTAPGQAVTASSADNVPFAANQVARMEIGHVGSDLHDFADEFVADDHGHGDSFPGPFVPAV